MKKFLSVIFLCLFGCFSFAGCGVKGSSSAVGIDFVQDVFYVDYNVETFLDYKVYPSTATNVYVNYVIEGDYSIESYFNFLKGSIKVINERFTSIKVVAKLNEYTDTCEVRLKEYPTSVQFENEEEYINAGAIYPLDLKGLFNEEIKTCKDRQYVFKVTSSNPSVIEIESEKDLLVRSTGRSGEAKVDVQICDSANKEKVGLKASVTLKVVENVADAFICIDNKVVHDEGALELVMSAEEEKRINVLYFDDKNFVNELAEYDIYLTNNKVFELLEDGTGYYLKLKNLTPTTGDKFYSVDLIIQSKVMNSEGNPYQVRCLIKVRVL